MNRRFDGAPGATIPERVAATVRPEILALTKYAVAKAPGMIKLDAMESPFALPEAVRAKVAAAAALVPVNRYPDGGADALKAALVQAFGLPGPASVILGNGSDELIQLITMALARPGAAMVAPEPSFEMYRMNALFAGMRYRGVPLRADFALDADAMEAAIAARATGARLPRVSEQSDRQPVRHGGGGAGAARGAGTRRRRRGLSCVRRRKLPRRGSLIFPTCSCCAPYRKSAWRGCGSGTRWRRPNGSRNSTKCVRRIISTQ